MVQAEEASADARASGDCQEEHPRSVLVAKLVWLELKLCAKEE